MKTIEYRVRPVTRYIVTRFNQEIAGDCASGGSECCGEFDRQDMAENVAKALADAEPHDDTVVSVNGYPLERCLTSIPASVPAKD